MKSANKRGLNSKPHREVMKDERPLFFGEHGVPVKDGRFSLPKQFRQFKDGKVTVFWKSSNFLALTLFPHTTSRSIARHKPSILKNVSIGPRGTVNLGRDVCQKVFNRLNLDAIVYGAGNGVQVWDKKAFVNWQKTNKDKYMNDWNEQTVRESFISKYQDSVRYCKEVKDGKLLRTDTYKNIYDEHWARCFVFDYLQVSLCVKSRERLLIELNLMIDRKITPFGSYNGKIFEKHRVNIINQLIAEFKQND